MSNLTTPRAFLRRNASLLAILVAALLAVPAVANASGSRHERPAGGSGLAIAADPLSIATGQCGGAPLTVWLTNTGTKAVYADATLSAPAALLLQRTVISTYLPAGYTAKVPVPVTAPLGTAPETYSVRLSAAGATATAPVTVTATAPDHTGDLARSASKITASTLHAGYPVCGAVDGDADSDHWGTTTGWNDGNSGIWPDWLGFEWDAPQTIGRVTMYTLNSTKYPAARYGLKDWDVQTFTDGQWRTIASVRGNTQGIVSTTFAPVQTSRLRVLTLAGNGANDYSRIIELQAFGS